MWRTVDERTACTRHLNVFRQCFFSRDIVKITLEEYERKERISDKVQDINKVRARMDKHVKLETVDADFGPFAHSVSVCRGLLNLTR